MPSTTNGPRMPTPEEFDEATRAVQAGFDAAESIGFTLKSLTDAALDASDHGRALETAPTFADVGRTWVFADEVRTQSEQLAKTADDLTAMLRHLDEGRRRGAQGSRSCRRRSQPGAPRTRRR